MSFALFSRLLLSWIPPPTRTLPKILLFWQFLCLSLFCVTQSASGSASPPALHPSIIWTRNPQQSLGDKLRLNIKLLVHRRGSALHSRSTKRSIFSGSFGATTKQSNNNISNNNTMAISSFLTKRATQGSTASFAGTEASFAPEEHELMEEAQHQLEQSAGLQQQPPTSVLPVSTAVSKRKTSIQNQPPQNASRDPIYIYSSLVAGVGSGALSSVMCAPLDLVRTRLQVWSDLNMPTATVRQAFADIFQKEGWRGYFRGLGASLVTVPAFWGVYFPLYDDCKRRWLHNHPTTNPSLVHCGSAVAAGAVSDILCNPMFVVRTRLQTEALHHMAEGTTARGSPGIVRTIKALYLEGGGISIFWRGMTANLMGLSHVAVQFPVYEWMKTGLVQQRMALARRSTKNNNLQEDELQLQQESEPTATELFLASGLSKMTASLLTYPHEVVRSRMMDSRGVSGASLWSTTSRVYAQDGMMGFYSGLPVALIRVIPNCCITFMTYELLLRLAKEEIRKRREGEPAAASTGASRTTTSSY